MYRRDTHFKAVPGCGGIEGCIHFQALHLRPKPFDRACTFMPKAHVRFQIMLIRPAEAAVSHFEKNLLADESVTMGESLHHFPIREALLDSVLDACVLFESMIERRL